VKRQRQRGQDFTDVLRWRRLADFPPQAGKITITRAGSPGLRAGRRPRRLDHLAKVVEGAAATGLVATRPP
jgi:hypothetical protein